jgi:hypothetical protein
LLKRLAAQAQSVTSSAKAGRQARDKPLQHYLLMPMFEWGVSEWHWNAALSYVKAFRPVCGFSPEEAQQAERVSIFGNEQGVSREVEESLRQAGCTVERISLANGDLAAQRAKS